ncbi:hypothetical protein SAMN04488026_11501 [Aliiruegeria lutimaris]|uniref:Uncharacterized protein n=1 Tax=Aliiruegeria lutimaris TaxID=571298 RepID=A0A1G9PW39_9RHOB|nr:hypothetical protein SAMN04488026_11501 [Aliiruegeria lutimaris]
MSLLSSGFEHRQRSRGAPFERFQMFRTTRMNIAGIVGAEKRSKMSCAILPALLRNQARPARSRIAHDVRKIRLKVPPISPVKTGAGNTDKDIHLPAVKACVTWVSTNFQAMFAVACKKASRGPAAAGPVWTRSAYFLQSLGRGGRGIFFTSLTDHTHAVGDISATVSVIAITHGAQKPMNRAFREALDVRCVPWSGIGWRSRRVSRQRFFQFKLSARPTR